MRVKNNIISFCLLMMGFLGWAQEKDTHTDVQISEEQMAQLIENEKVYMEWFQDIETPGVRLEGDQMLFSKEAQKLAQDATYRSQVYKKDGYTFVDVRDSFGRSDIKMAFWQMLTIYPENKENIIRYIYAFDKVMPTDKVVVGAFYTYGFFDPEITRIEGGKPNIYRPDLFEEYLRRAREIVAYISYLREEEAKKTKN